MIKKWLTFLGLMLCMLAVYSQKINNEGKLEELFRKKLFREADSLLSARILKDTTSAELNYYKGYVKEELFQLLPAEKAYAKAAQLDTSNKAYWHALAGIRVKTGNWKSAVQIYQKQLLRDGLHSQYAGELAAVYLRQKIYGQALELYDTLIAVDSMNYFFLKQAGYCNQKLGGLEKAVTLYRKALKVNPQDIQLYSKLGNIFIKRRNFEEAIRISDEGLKQDSTDNGLRKLKAYAYYLNRDFDQSITGFTRVLEMKDSSFFTKKYLGLAFFESQLYDTASHWLVEAFIHNSNDPELTFYTGSSLIRSGEPNRGISFMFTTLNLLNPPNKELADIYNEIAEAYIVKEQYENAVKYLRMAYKKDTRAIFSFKLGNIYDRYLHDKEMAINYYEGYIDIRTAAGDDKYDNTASWTNMSLPQIASKRIKLLKEDMFFEGN